ncbi:hypothetical protein HG536_0A02510 [Torulaspora globosa]|uniref:Uncharacterized protein n=1 Tax=Torulaspora globosa TaxID=48254 RepID=A0A7G3ZA98_9SACH|nr:uncharacterized protein HG536_0A02510 [Torulaspora globosa]QLL30434.1 hypothetical protein HG536_0A02510 [Torulaspora globosa]
MNLFHQEQTEWLRFRMGHFNMDFSDLTFRNSSQRPSFHKNTVALVTGGSRGLGLELVLRLASCGIKVINVDVMSPTHKLREADNVYFYRCDITDHDEVKALHEKISSEHGPVTILLNNAGITRINTVDIITHEEIKAVIAVNLIGAYIMINTFLPDMIAEKHGFIVNIASVLGEIAPARLTSYAASKGGLIAIHNSLARQLCRHSKGSRSIKMLLVCPGKINTSMFARVKTPSKILAPDIDPGKLADRIVTAIRCNNITTLRYPYYVNIVPFFKQLSWPYMRLLKKCSGIDKATAVSYSYGDVSPHGHKYNCT